MKRNFIVLLTVCLFAGAVAIGVHLWHKDALAANLHTVQIFFDDGLRWVPFEGCEVSIGVETSEGVFTYDNGLTDENGEFDYDKFHIPAATKWKVEMIEPGWTLDGESDFHSVLYAEAGHSMSFWAEEE